MTADGILTCKGIKATNGTFTGTLETDIFYAGDDEVIIGDYYVSADGTNVLRSKNGYVEISCNNKPSGSPGGTYASLHIGGSNYAGVDIDGLGNASFGNTSVLNLVCNSDMTFPNNSWVAGWTLIEMLKDLYNRVSRLSDRIDDLE